MTVVETEQVVVKVGDFFTCSWGWDQTNVDFYKVVGVTPSGKSVRVQQWESMTVEDNGPGGSRVMAGGRPRQEFVGRIDYSRPFDDQPDRVYADAPVLTKRLRLGGYKGASFFVASYADAYLWDGTAQYETSFGFGH